MTTPRHLVFVLGTQRSGTTWVSNIFDSHPRVIHVYEPFAPDADLFPYFPNEFEDRELSEGEMRRLQHDVERLSDHRSRFFDQATAGERRFRFETAMMKRIHRFNRKARRRSLNFATRFIMLQQNRMGQDPVAYFYKAPDADWLAIKEVRLYFRVPLLARAFPHAKFIHLVRHPGAVVNSMCHYMSQGRLGELRANIDQFHEAIAHREGLEPWREVLSATATGTLEERLAAFWKVTNDVMARDLAGLGSRSRRVVYEELAMHPAEVVRSMLDWCGVGDPDETREYVAASSTARDAKLDVLSTSRESSSYSRSWTGKIDAGVRASVERICAGPLLDEIARFYHEPAAGGEEPG